VAPVGTVEWFGHRKRAIIEHAKAIDDFGVAARAFRRLVELGPDGDPEVHAALHTQGVISYARPFIGPVPVSKRLIASDPGFENEIHEQLLVLRHKLVAHSDAEFADARLFLKRFNVDNDSGSSEPTVLGAVVMARNVHTVHRPELARACLSHARRLLAAQRAVSAG
jgi:hypothetical protein